MPDVHPRDLGIEPLDVRIGEGLDSFGAQGLDNILLAGNPDPSGVHLTPGELRYT